MVHVAAWIREDAGIGASQQVRFGHFVTWLVKQHPAATVALGHADRLLRLRTLYMSDDARDLVAIVGERYKEDIARFGYVFPENSSAPTLRT